VDKASDGFKFEQSDIHPERKQRLGDYLTSTTQAASDSNTDVTNTGHRNTYSIDGEDNNGESFEKEIEETVLDQEDLFKEAFDLFHQISTGASFDDPAAIQPVKGKHEPVDHSAALNKMKESVSSALTTNTRWSGLGIGTPRFPVSNSTDVRFSSGDASPLSDKDDAHERNEKFLNKRNPTFNTGPIPGLAAYSDENDRYLNDVSESNLPDVYGNTGGEKSSYTTKTYGHWYNAEKPFEELEFPPDQTGQFVLDLLELFLQGFLGANSGNVAQVLNYTVSEGLANGGFPSAKEPKTSQWENIYANNPKYQDPTKLMKGSSGWNQHAYHHHEAHDDTEYGGFAGKFPTTADEILKSIKSTEIAKSLVSTFLNVPSHILRDFNVSVPRHTYTWLRKKDSSFGREVIDIFVSYLYAASAGIIHLVQNAIIRGTLDFRERGFLLNMTRNIQKNRSYYYNWVHSDEHHSFWHGFDDFMGLTNKTVKFFNYCVLIGDITVVSKSHTHARVSENKIPLDAMHDHPSLRLAKYRRHSSRESTFSMGSLPSLYLVPDNEHLFGGMTQINGGSEKFNYMGSIDPLDEKITEDGIKTAFKEHPNGSHSHFAVAKNRFSTETVKAVEDALEAEMMPFYIQDLRTNEIIAFHAFLTDLSDSYSAEWSAQKGFGRMEAAQIYGGGSRSVGVGFTMVAFNERDFDEMWYKINKLTTLVYPQWSQGTKMDFEGDELGSGSIIQPFSQVPTASPMCRLRVGDLFTSNYSKQNVARLFGVGSETKLKFKGAQTVTDTRYLLPSGIELYRSWAADRNMDINTQHPIKVSWTGGENNNTGDVYVTVGNENHYFLRDVSEMEWKAISFSPISSTQDGDGTFSANNFSAIFDSNNNPIIKSFESTKGRGLAVAVTSITFAWKYGEVGWNSEPGSRAPRMCDVSLSVIPIHDITPGLDHNGFNRAPIYGVGNIASQMKGDPHYSTPEYNKAMDKINQKIQHTLRPLKGGH
jgi:hypothetical protein